MRYPRSSLGFLGIFGRSEDLRRFDRALRSVDAHPAIVPDAVKLTVMSLLKEEYAGEPEPQSYRAAAELLGYCILGEGAFEAANGGSLTMAVEKRIETALEAGSNLDANLILLALHAKIIQPSVMSRYQFETG